MQAHGFENVTLDQTEEWLKMALITTPLTVMDEVASMPSPPEGGGSESANWPTSQPQLKGTEAPHTPTTQSRAGGTEAPHTPSLETGLEGTEVQNSRTSEPETEGRHSS